MDDYPSTRSQQKQYHGQPTAGPSSNMPGLMPSSSNPNNGSGYRPSDNPGFWSSTSMRTTYASYKSHPDAWQKNYLSTIEDLKAFSFGNPASDVVDQEDKRWKIARREENETSSSSSDDGESRRRLGGRSRDVTPRASVVSLDDPVDQPDTHLRSHPSQLQQINYYQRGPSNFGNKIREMNDRDQSSELRERVNDEERRPESRSDFSIYSGYDTGYDAASSHLSRSHSYAPSYTSDHARTRADADAETISISSSRPASSAASGVGPLLDGDRPYDSDDLSISSVRRSSSYDEEYEQAKGVFVYDDAPRPSDANPGRISLESAASSNMHLSVSSLRFDYGLDVTTNEQPEVGLSSLAHWHCLGSDLILTSGFPGHQCRL
ncbi:hypothetical protein J3R30DRAFT_2408912 [Lentinula aciculospora]|uniref:Uncharacterized protein n=1 Tax=Lentinula aciculospora TaxID=153920 RepID=A0A9W9AFW8_9AGAR|nr:hypothetical protein J3R30DRAFT_2408912 [Lentinula aciculospora]